MIIGRGNYAEVVRCPMCKALPRVSVKTIGWDMREASIFCLCSRFKIHPDTILEWNL